MNKYNNIKRILRTHIEKGIKSLWTFDQKNKVFTNVYQQYNDNLQS